MSHADSEGSRAVVVEEEIVLTLHELSHACGADETVVSAWVLEGVLDAAGTGPTTWRFAGTSLRRARTAARLTRDFEIDARAVALVLDLLDEIDRLKAQLR